MMLAPQRTVLVIHPGDGEERAVFGRIAALAAVQRGITGVVVGVCLRDSDAIRGLRFPAFARGTVPTSPRPRQEGDLGGVVRVGGIVVWPGDLVADGDGVVVVQEETDAVLARAGEFVAQERVTAAALPAETPV